MEYTAVEKNSFVFATSASNLITMHLSHVLISPLCLCSDRWMNLKQVSLVGWAENSGVALVGFQPIMPRGYLRAKPRSACVQQPQPHPPQSSNQLPQHHQLLDTPPPPLPPTVTGPISVPRECPLQYPFVFVLLCLLPLIAAQLSVYLYLFVVGPPTQPISQKVKDGMHGQRLHQPIKILRSVFRLRSSDSAPPLHRLL